MSQKISGSRLADLVKKQRGIRTSKEIEVLTGINQQIIERIESGRYIPPLLQLNKLLSFLEIQFIDIIEQKDQSVFVAMMGEAKTEEEVKGFEKMISMMLCLRKYERLKEVMDG